MYELVTSFMYHNIMSVCVIHQNKIKRKPNIQIVVQRGEYEPVSRYLVSCHHGNSCHITPCRVTLCHASKKDQ